MNLFKIILIVTAINLPLGVYISTLFFPSASVALSGPAPVASVSTEATSVSVAAKETPSVQSSEDMVLLKTQVNALTADVAALREEIHAMVKAKAATAILGRVADHTAPPNEEVLRAEEEKYFTTQGEALESDFRQQTVSSAWSTEAMDLIRAGLASDKIAGSAIVSLECRTRTCRLELANNGKKQASDFVEFPQHIAGELSNMLVSQTESSEGSTVFYLSKEAFVLPH